MTKKKIQIKNNLAINTGNSGSLIIYTGPKGTVELRADTKKDTIWATLDQIAELFDVQKAAISKHLKNISDSNELPRNPTVSKMETVQIEGSRSVKRQIEFYNLDAIIAVGYRVNSKQATQFRIWATKTLKEYLIKGIVMNTERIKKLPDKILKDLDEKISFIQRTIQKRELNKSEVDGLIGVIHDYANAWSLLKEYDEGDLVLKRGRGTEKQHFDYGYVRPAVDRLKLDLMTKSEAGDLFCI